MSRSDFQRVKASSNYPSSLALLESSASVKNLNLPCNYHQLMGILEPTPFREGVALQLLPYAVSDNIFAPILLQDKNLVEPFPSTTTSSSTNTNHRKLQQSQESLWEGHFQDLLKFKATHGHCSVPHTYPANIEFARWCKRQRYQYKLLRNQKKSLMSEERLNRLEGVGFVWDPQSIAWEAKLMELVEFKAEHGHCNVPCRYPPNPKLGAWAKRQRRQYKLYKSGASINISPDRFRILSEMGFQFQMQGCITTEGNTLQL